MHDMSCSRLFVYINSSARGTEETACIFEQYAPGDLCIFYSRAVYVYLQLFYCSLFMYVVTISVPCLCSSSSSLTLSRHAS